ncbi:MAG: hypothetical protein IT428_04715 [Planctomycetaceae bacterium]|nr:hypothetical protein [Planctomycetaceae bacterium]
MRRLLIPRIALLSLLGVTLSAGEFAAASDDVRLDDVIALLERQETLLTRARLHFTEQSRMLVKGKLVEQTVTTRTASQGAKLRSEMEMITARGKVTSIDAFDNERHQTHKPNINRGTVSSEGAVTSNYLHHIYNAKTGLATELKKVRASLASKWVEVAGERLLLVEWNDAASRFDNQAWLNPKAGFQPRLVVRKTRFAAPREGGTTGMKIVTAVKAYRQDHGAWFPSSVARNLEITYVSGKPRHDEMNFELLEAQTDVDVPDEEFVIRYPPGTRLFDADARLHYIVGADGQWERTESPLATTAAITIQPWWSERWILWSIVATVSSVACYAAWRQFRLVASTR